MTPPKATEDGAPRAAFFMETLKKRSDFLAVAKGHRAQADSLHLQALDRDDDNTVVRVGITATKKVGNAVSRNRAKRRLRAVARSKIASHGLPGWDYVLVARPSTTNAVPFDALENDLERSLGRIHKSSR